MPRVFCRLVTKNNSKLNFAYCFYFLPGLLPSNFTDTYANIRHLPVSARKQRSWRYVREFPSGFPIYLSG